MICDLSTYRRLTGDGIGGSVDGDVTAALNDAQNEAERYCSRHFELGTYTETMRLFSTGRVYPKAFPIVSVAGNTSSTIDGSSVILGYGYQYATGINPFVSGFGADSTAYQPQVTLTYTGGYAADQMPADLKRAIAVMAFNSLHPSALTNVPVGATSIRVGDTAVSGARLATFASMDASVVRILRRYKRPMVEAF